MDTAVIAIHVNIFILTLMQFSNTEPEVFSP